MINLLNTIYNKISEAHSRVFFNFVPEKDPTTQKEVKFPYIVFKLPSSIVYENTEQFILEVSIWDKSSDETGVETLAEEVNKKLNRWDFLDDNFLFRVRKTNRLTVPDPDPQIKRRDL